MTDAEFTRLAVSPDGAQGLASGFIQNASTNKPPLFGAALTPGGASPFALEPTPSDGAIRSGNGVVNGGSAFIAYSYQPSGSANYIVRPGCGWARVPLRLRSPCPTTPSGRWTAPPRR